MTLLVSAGQIEQNLLVASNFCEDNIRVYQKYFVERERRTLEQI